MAKTHVSIWVTPDELQMIELIKHKYQRKTYSDLLRFLIYQENEKILSQNISKEIIQEKGASV